MMPLSNAAVGHVMLEVLMDAELANAGGTTDVVRAEPRITTPIQVVSGENAPGVVLRR
jgi:hypothetical protein